MILSFELFDFRIIPGEKSKHAALSRSVTKLDK
jgi:hypothetical protein